MVRCILNVSSSSFVILVVRFIIISLEFFSLNLKVIFCQSRIVTGFLLIKAHFQLNWSLRWMEKLHDRSDHSDHMETTPRRFSGAGRSLRQRSCIFPRMRHVVS